ncbi:MAG TPA: DUF417 family protein [Polyangiaceae bacterium]|jgi:uncharacterized membrane protein YkgB
MAAPETSFAVLTTMPTKVDQRLHLLQRVAGGTLRYGLSFLLVMWGAFKFTAFEAEGIRPLIEHSPFMSWMYALFSVRTTSGLLGVFEVSVGLLILGYRVLPRASGVASLAASAMFLITLSFLASTPGVLEPTNQTGGFLMKDILLLGAALFTASESFRAGRRAGGRTR